MHLDATGFELKGLGMDPAAHWQASELHTCDVREGNQIYPGRGSLFTQSTGEY